MAQNTDFGQVANDLRNAAGSFAALTSSASLLGQALGAFREFEKQLVLTNAIAQGTVAQFEEMKQAAREFSLVTTTSAIDAGRALQQLAQAGFTAQQSLNAMNGVLLLAQATLADVGVTSDVLSSNIRAFKLEAQDTTRVANVFAAAITGSLATMDKLAFAFRQVAPVAELAGLSIEETTASLGVLFNVGLRGEQAGTALRNIIIRLVRPLGEAGDMLRDAGIATRTATGELRNLADIMEDIADSDLSNAQLARIFETEALAGVKAYISALKDIEVNGRSAYQNLLNDITNTDRATELAAANLETFDGSMGLLRNTVTDLQRDLGEALAPTLIEMSDTVRELVASFRELDPETQQSIARMTAFAAAGTGIVTALTLVAGAMRALGVIHLARLSVGLFTATGGLHGMAAAAIRLSATLGALIPGITVGMTALSSIPAIAAGFGIAATAITGAYFALDNFITTAKELDAALEVDSDAFRIAEANANDTADAILGKGLEKEIAGRVNAIQRQLQILSVASPQDRFGFAGRKVDTAEEQAKLAREKLDELSDNFDEVREVFLLEEAFQTQLERDARERDKGFPERIAGYLGYTVENRLNGIIEDYIDDLNEEQKAALKVLRERGGDLIEADQEARKLVKELQDAESGAISEFLDQLALGRAQVREENAAVADFIQREGILDGLDINALADAIAAEEGATTETDILRKALERAGVPAEDIVKLFAVFQEEKTNKLIAGLEELANGFDEDLKKIEITLAEREADFAKTLAEATQLATSAGLKQTEVDLSKLADDLKDDYGDVLVDFGIDLREGVLAEIQSIAGESVDLGADAPGFTELVNGTWLVDNINDAIDESTTVEEAQAIIQKEFEKYTNIFDAYVEALIAAGTVDEATAKAIRAAVAKSSALIAQSYIDGLGETDEAIEDQEKRFERLERKEKSAANRKLREAKKALSRERKIADIYTEIADISRDARVSVYEATRGIDLSDREDFLLGTELEDIVSEYDNQITELQRKLEDIELDFEGTPGQLEEIREGYRSVISEIEAAKQAEIDAANSFTSMMDRRSKALDLFRRDLQDLAFEAQDTATKVGAGIAMAFADYQEQLITLTDITKDAVTGVLDALTTGIADFIFDNENAWESFKKTMLNISREIFEGFTKSLLQQAISSMTGGEGSIFGNALQPSGVQSTGVPGVGTGGLLGKLFPGLSGMFGQASPQSGNGAGTFGIEQDQVYQQQLNQTRGTLQNFNTGMQTATRNTVQAMQSIATTFQQTAASMGGGFAGGGITGTVAGAFGEVSAGFGDITSAAQGVLGGFGNLSTAASGSVGAFKDVTSSTRDLLAKAIFSEAGSESALGQLAVGSVIANRASLPGFGGSSLEDVILSPGQFSAFNGITGYAGGAGANNLVNMTPPDSVYKIADQIISGKYNDPTGGATHYYNPSVVEPAWGARRGTMHDGRWDTIGNHTFGSAEGVRAATEPLTASMNSLSEQFTVSTSGLTESMAGLGSTFENLPGLGMGGESALGGSLFSTQTPGAGTGFVAQAASAIPGMDALQQTMTQIGAFTQQTLQQTVAGIGTQLTVAGTQTAQQVRAGGTRAASGLNEAGTKISSAADSAASKVAASGSAGGGGGGGIFGTILSFASNLFAEGGEPDARGYTGFGMTYAPAGVVHKGEYVINKRQTSKWRDVLALINEGKASPERLLPALKGVPGFSAGGFADGSFAAPPSTATPRDPSVTPRNKREGRGDTINIKASYVVQGGSQSKRETKRSADQFAKRLGQRLERAKRNT